MTIEDIRGCYEKLDAGEKDAVKFIVAHYHMRDGVPSPDGSIGSIRITQRQLHDALSFMYLCGLAERMDREQRQVDAAVANDDDSAVKSTEALLSISAKLNAEESEAAQGLAHGEGQGLSIPLPEGSIPSASATVYDSQQQGGADGSSTPS